MGLSQLFRDSPVFCSSGLFILVDVASIPCNVSNSFCTCLGITTNLNPLFFPFFPIGKSTQQFSCKYVLALKPKSSCLDFWLWLWFYCLLNFWYWLSTTWCCDWLLYFWFDWPSKMIFLSSWLTSFWNYVLFSVCCGGLLKGRFSRTAVWVSIKALIISSLEWNSLCKNSMLSWKFNRA